MLESFRSRGALLALPIVLSAVTFAHADRPDRPAFAYQSTFPDGNQIDFINNLPGAGTALFAAGYCNALVSGWNVSFRTTVLDADLTKNLATKASVKQKAYVAVRATFYDGMTLVDSGEIKVQSCKAQGSISDGDGDLDFDGGLDVLSFSAKCGSDLTTSLALPAPQAAMFTEAFGDKPACKLSGTPAMGCFRGDTMVATERGPRAIRDIKVGDKVWSWDEKTGERVLQPVLQTMLAPAQKTRTLVASGETFHVTDQHPFWVEGKGWTTAANIAANDKLRVRDGENLTVATNVTAGVDSFFAGYDRATDFAAVNRHPTFSIVSASFRSKTDAMGYVYNLEVAGSHSYFVGEKQVLVHNK